MHVAYYHIHALGDCEFCLDALKLIQDNGYEYVLTLYDKSPNGLNYIKYVLDHPTVPIIYEYTKDNKFRKIGGYTELKNEFDRVHGQG